MAGYVETILPFSEKAGGSGIKKPHSPATIIILILKERNSFYWSSNGRV